MAGRRDGGMAGWRAGVGTRSVRCRYQICSGYQICPGRGLRMRLSYQGCPGRGLNMRTPYYNQVLLLPSSGPWGVAPSYSPWPVTSTDIHQAGPQFEMGMVPFEGTAEGPAYFFPEESPEKAVVPLQWGDCDPEGDNVNYFNVDVTLWDKTDRSAAKELSAAELNGQLEKLLQDKADNLEIIDWVETNLVEQKSSNGFIRALMTCICRASIIRKKPYKLDGAVMKRRAGLLWHYLTDEQKELQALYALQALVVELNPRANLLQMLFQCLYDHEVITEEAFFLWESSKDLNEQQGKDMALKSLTTFLIWLHESDNSE